MNRALLVRKVRSAAKRFGLASARVARGIRGEIDVTPLEILALLFPFVHAPQPYIAASVRLDPALSTLIERMAARTFETYSQKKKAIVILVGPRQHLNDVRGRALVLAHRGYDILILRLLLKSTLRRTEGWHSSIRFREVVINPALKLTPLSYYSEEAVGLAAAQQPFAIETSHVMTACVALDAATRTGARVVLDASANGFDARRCITGAPLRPALAKAFASALREMAILALRRAALITARDASMIKSLETLASLDKGTVQLDPTNAREGAKNYSDQYDRLWSEKDDASCAPQRVNAPRVLHAPCNIGNQPWVLSRAERTLGLKSELVVNHLSPFNYPADRILSKVGHGSVNDLLARSIAAISAPHQYDVLHYYFGQSLMDWDDLSFRSSDTAADLRKARALGKTVVMTLQGCDVRLAAESNARNKYTPCAVGRCDLYETCIDATDQVRRNMIENVLPYCDQVFFLNPELGHFVPKGVFMPYANVDIWALNPRTRMPQRRFKIVHAPTSRGIKGTDIILAALESLSERYDFELVLVQGMTHEQAMAQYAEADIAIDQIFAGWYGGLAVELMAMGVPVMCYLREEDFVHLPEGLAADLPLLNLNPDHVAQDIEAVLQRRDEWPQFSQASRTFVEKWHDPRKIAGWLKGIYADAKHPASPFRPNQRD